MPQKQQSLHSSRLGKLGSLNPDTAELKFMADVGIWKSNLNNVS